MSEWIKWEGGGRPVHGHTLVDVKFRNGDICNSDYADGWFWGECDDLTIVEYRPSQPRKTLEEAYGDADKPISDSALNVQIGGDHYKKLKIQPAEYSHANNMPFLEGNAIKYITRWRDKGGITDLRKAIHDLQMLIELEGK